MEGNKPERKEKNTGERGLGIWGEFALFSICFLSVVLIASLLFLQSVEPPSWEFGEESLALEKTSSPSFEGGDEYSYSMLFRGQNSSALLHAKYSPNCPGLVLEEQGAYSPCILDSGFYSNSSGYLGNPDFAFYSPWMLYLHENFSWKFNRTVTFYPSNLTQKAQLLFEVANTTEIFGREAFVVMASKISSPPLFADDFFANSTYFVDVQKRVLLAANSSNAQILIENAPFELKK